MGPPPPWRGGGRGGGGGGGVPEPRSAGLKQGRTQSESECLPPLKHESGARERQRADCHTDDEERGGAPRLGGGPEWGKGGRQAGHAPAFLRIPLFFL